MAIFDGCMGCYYLFLSLHIARSKPSIQFLIKRTYGLEGDVGWSIPLRLFSTWPSLMCECNDFCYFWVAIMSEALLKFLLKRINGLKEDVGWRRPRWLFSAWPSLICEWDYFCYFWVAIMSEALLKFLLKRIYGLKEDVGWRIPRWLFSTWPSLMCKWGDFSYFWVSILQEAFHLVSVQEDIWFGRCWLKNSKMAVQCMAIFDVWMGWFLLFLILHIVISLPSSLCSREYYGLEEDVGWRNSRWLFSVRQSLICKCNDLTFFLSLHVPGSLPSSFCSREHIVWKKMLVE